MNMLVWACGILLGSLGLNSGGFAAHHGQTLLSMVVHSSDLELQSESKAVLRITGRDLSQNPCFYIAQHDPLYLEWKDRHSLRGSSEREKNQRTVAKLSWARPDLFEEIYPGYVRLRSEARQGLEDFAFSYQWEGWTDQSSDVRVLKDFYPQLLQACPSTEPKERPDPRQFLPVQLEIQAPGEWQHGVQKTAQEQVMLIFSRHRSWQTFALPGLELRLLGKTQEFFALHPTILSILSHHYQVLKQWPTETLTLIEGDDYDAVEGLGIILVNRPKQSLMRNLQEKWLRWNLWQLTVMLAEQWFGYALSSAKPDDQWLAQAFADILSFEYVQGNPDLKNIFHPDLPLDLSYLDLQNLLAASLSISGVPSALLEADKQSVAQSWQRPKYSFVRASLALRFLRYYMGADDFAQLLQQTMQEFQGGFLQPQELSRFWSKRFPDKHRELLAIFFQYLSSRDWPDFAFVSWQKEGEGCRIFYRQPSELLLPFYLEITLQTGAKQRFFIDGRSREGSLYVPFDLAEIQSVELDPDRWIFDVDRFNNTSDWTGLKIFPGNARGLSDEHYTLLWVPFAQKLPGNSLSLQLGWQWFRYLGSGAHGLIVYHPSENKTGFRLNWLHAIPRFGLDLQFLLAQDDDRTTPSERWADLSLTRLSLSPDLAFIQAGMRLRSRQSLQDSKKSHATGALFTRLNPKFSRQCQWQWYLEWENSLWVPSQAFDYVRYASLWNVACERGLGQLRLRAFWGKTVKRGPSPDGSYFALQNIEEARLRLDAPRLPKQLEVKSLGLDLASPLRLPLPDNLMILPRRSLVKAYWDLAWARESKKRWQARGLGLVLPIGGDIVGKQSLTMLELSLLAVLYREIEQKGDQKPGFLFDLTGQL